ncbi:MAG: TetR/AcrR family transcriptional regulator [Pseudomonadota bacterium]
MVKLTIDDWVALGLETLVEEGFPALKADRLTKKAGVTRGSFYGYFKDVSAFHEALHAAWFDRSRRVTEAAAALPVADRLGHFISASAEADTRLEQAMRAWAYSNAKVQQQVTELDAYRLRILRQTLEDMGLSEADAALRAKILYASAIGSKMVPEELMSLSPQDFATLATLLAPQT